MRILKLTAVVSVVLAASPGSWPGPMPFAARVIAGERGWPTHLGDNRRSGATTADVAPPLVERWRYRAAHAPRPSWPPPAERSHWQRLATIEPRTTHDRAFHVVVAGDAVFFGSSADDSVRRLDLESGAEQWTFATDGPIRIAPAIDGDRVYFASDDGRVYCVGAANGEAIWIHDAAPSRALVVGNGRLISTWPIRTGVLVDGGVVLGCAGLFPTQGVFAFALDAGDGSVIWRRELDGVSPQGYLLASPRLLYVPQGRASPFAIAREDGDGMQTFPGVGGSYALLAGETLLSGPGNVGELTVADAASRDRLASVNGSHLVATTTTSWLHARDRLSAIDRTRHLALSRERKQLEARRDALRKELKREGADRARVEREIAAVQSRLVEIGGELRKCVLWEAECGHPLSLILAGSTLFAGGEDSVAAHDASNGARVWTAPVEGKAYGLGAVPGRLLVSTDRGVIHCFAAGDANAGAPRVVDGGESAAVEVAPRISAAVERILGESRIDPGLCVVAGCGSGELALEIARRTRMTVVGFDRDPASVESARALLRRAGVHGARVTVHHVEGETLPIPDGVANLVVSEDLVTGGETVVTRAEIERVVRPYGGVALVPGDDGWTLYRRPALPGAGEWTHQYADPGNTACSADTLIGSALRLQWFGGPGPRRMIDRHLRPVPPLVSRGRLFIPGNDLVIAVDAYNGSELWEARLAGSRRLGAPYDTSFMAAVGDRLYVATGEECRALDAATGETVATYTAPAGEETEQRWGHVAVIDGRLIGTTQRPGASRTRFSREDVVEQYRELRPLVTGDGIFAFDVESGALAWSRRAGLIPNTSIAASEGSVYFLESRSAAARENRDGRVTLDALLERDAHVVALDLRNGAVRWERPYPAGTTRHILYTCATRGTVVLVGSNNQSGHVWYHVEALDARDGTRLWKRDHANNRPGIGGDHGEQVHHPVIAGTVVIAEPLAYDLRTGARVDRDTAGAAWAIARRSGCGTISASSTCLYYRDSNPTALDLTPGHAPKKVTRVNRPGCWISIIPAGGLLLLPEASSGCVCGYPLQTSMAFGPR